ncbi:unnamed protein product [Periconia digitata]|uniref:Uncharacterized protein n=1 Tax=Periconia digitata TaxID=1303443 RepID=A0A9W4XQ52_9PLEO|nr:unnamed protein product [Periconia digitata]
MDEHTPLTHAHTHEQSAGTGINRIEQDTLAFVSQHQSSDALAFGLLRTRTYLAPPSVCLYQAMEQKSPSVTPRLLRCQPGVFANPARLSLEAASVVNLPRRVLGTYAHGRIPRRFSWRWLGHLVVHGRRGAMACSGVSLLRFICHFRSLAMLSAMRARYDGCVVWRKAYYSLWYT